MRKYNKYLLAGLVLPLLLFSTNALANEENNLSTDAVSEYDNNNDFFANAVVERDNDFCIYGKSKDYWTQVNFSIDSYSVTDGQPFSGINPKNQPSDKKCVRVRSGRHNSLKPMKWAFKTSEFYQEGSFIQPLFAQSDSFCPHSGEPCAANFAFTGTLKLENKQGQVFSCLNVVIGQGGAGFGFVTHNLWFIYSNVTGNLNSLKCTNEQGNEIYMRLNSVSGSVYNTFKITP